MSPAAGSPPAGSPPAGSPPADAQSNGAPSTGAPPAGPPDASLLPAGPSLARRTALAVALAAGFYILAIGLASLVVLIALMQLLYWRILTRLTVELSIASLLAGLVIAWLILPHPRRFTAPGPRLERARQPRLFAELDRTAAAAGQPLPAEVYLYGDVGAGVGETSSLFRRGRRRILVVGLPLLQVLTVEQLRAVLAHEYGHYDARARLGPWIYDTYRAAQDMLQIRSSSILRRPFVWYSREFMRLISAVARHEEAAADALAAQVAGGAAASAALEAIDAAGEAFEMYWYSEFVPVVQAGYRPPLLEGFARFLAVVLDPEKAPPVVAELEKIRQRMGEQVLVQEESDPFDSHAPLPERLAALQQLGAGPPPERDPSPALALLDDVPELERALVAALVRKPGAARVLQPVTWEEVPDRVILPQWRAVVRDCRAALAGLTPADLPELARDPEPFRARLLKVASRAPTPQEAERLPGTVIGVALAVVLTQHGWTLRLRSGHPILLENGDVTIDPLECLRELAIDPQAAERWAGQMAATGCAGLDLAEAGEAPPGAEAEPLPV